MRMMPRPWPRAAFMGFIAVLVYSFFVLLLLPRAGGHPWGLLGFSRHLVLSSQNQVPERFISEKFGYDGQAYFVLALSPFGKDPSQLGFRFDNQMLRQQRILYPAIVHFLARGNSERTAWMMVIVNVLAIGAVVVLAAGIFVRLQQPPWLALLVGLYPGFAISVSRGLTEPVCLMWILAGVLVWRRYPLWAGVLLGLAVLTRETAILVAAGFGCAWLAGRIKKDVSRPSIMIWILPLMAYVVWHGWLMFQVADSLASVASSNIGWPVAGFAGALWKNMTQLDILHLYFLFFMAVTVAWQFFVARTTGKQWTPVFYAWILCGALLVAAGLIIWDNSPSFMRISTEWNILGLLLVAGSGFSRWKPVAAAWASTWILAAGGEWYRYGLIF